jgi:hypothetical protein
MPPLSLMNCASVSKPCLICPHGAALSPVNEIAIPMTTGAVLTVVVVSATVVAVVAAVVPLVGGAVVAGVDAAVVVVSSVVLSNSLFSSALPFHWCCLMPC